MYNKAQLLFVLTLSFFLTAVSVNAQMVVVPGLDSQIVMNHLGYCGTQISNITITANSSAAGWFSNGNTVNPGMNAGIVLSSGDVNGIPGISSNFQSTDLGTGGDPDLEIIAGGGTGSYTSYDASILEFDIVPFGDRLKFKFVFASEEYNDYVNSLFVDAVGAFISGPGISGPFSNSAMNMMLIPGTNLPVGINNVNNGTASGCSTGPCENCQYFIDNTCTPVPFTYNGMTIQMEASTEVIPNQTYHIKIAVCDIGDGVYDSGLFIEAGSFCTTSSLYGVDYESPGDSIDAAIEGCSRAILFYTLDHTYAYDSVLTFISSGTAQYNLDYTVSSVDTLIIPAGQLIGKVYFEPLADGLTEGTEYLFGHLITDTNALDFTIAFSDPVPLTISVTEDDTICVGQLPFYIGVDSVEGLAPITYTWSNGLPCTAGPFPVNPAPGEQTYYVSVTDGCGTMAEESISVYVDLCTGTQESRSVQSELMTVYPNPSTGKIYISCNENVSGKWNAEVCELTGKMVLQTELTGNNCELDLSFADNGLYLIRLSADNMLFETILLSILK